MISFDSSLRLGDLITLVGGIFAAGMLYQRVSAIEHKLDSFVTREVLAEKQKAADQEHASIRRELNGVRHEVELIADKK